VRYLARLMLAAAVLCAEAMAVAVASEALESRGVIRVEAQVVLDAEIAGRVTALPVRAGEAFNRGDLLALIDCRLYEAEQDKVDAQLDAARAELRSNQRLAELDSGSGLDVEMARTAVAIAEADARIVALNVDRCRIEAPFDGQVVRREASLHEYVEIHAPILEVVSTEQFFAEVVIPSHWLDWLRPGAPVMIRVDETGVSFETNVSRIGASVDAASQTTLVYIDFPENLRTTLLPGMSLTAIFRSDA